MGRVAFMLAVFALVAPAPVRAADATAPAAAEAQPAAEAPSVVVEPPLAETAPMPPPAPAVRVATPAPAVTATPGRRPKRETHGLALAAGLGIAYGFLGLQARYDIPIRPWLIVSPFVSAGVAFGLLSGPIGVSTALGARHRFVVDLGVAPLDRMLFSLHGTTVAEPIVFGPMLAAGYEHMSDRGWFQRTTIEFGYATWTTVAVPVDSHPALFGGLAFGRRIW
jgi:hypothetical protein